MLYGVIVILVGVFCIFCAYKDYDWFVNSRKAWLFQKLFGRNGTRIVYMIIGALFVAAGIFVMIFGIDS